MSIIRNQEQIHIARELPTLRRARPYRKKDDHVNTTIDLSLVISFVVVILLLVLSGGGLMAGGMIGGGLDDSGWIGEGGWMWTPTLLTLCLGVVLGGVIYKRGLLQTDWEKGESLGRSQIVPRGLHGRIDPDRLVQSKFKKVAPSVLGMPEPSLN